MEKCGSIDPRWTPPADSTAPDRRGKVLEEVECKEGADELDDDLRGRLLEPLDPPAA